MSLRYVKISMLVGSTFFTSRVHSSGSPRRGVAEENVVAHKWHMTSADAVVELLVPELSSVVGIVITCLDLKHSLKSSYGDIPITSIALHSICGGSVLPVSSPHSLQQ